jgi:hypothetical protein
MQHGIDPAGDEDEVGDVVLDEAEVLSTGQVGDVLDLPGDQVVNHDDLMAFGEQAITQMGTDEPGTACNQDSHL